MSVTAPQGFRAAGVTAGLKASGRPDVAVVVNDGPEFAAAGVFTSNRVQAAPVRWTAPLLARYPAGGGEIAAVVLNSGGANACTGAAGLADTVATAEHLAGLLQVDPRQVAVCSTGLIGERLPMPTLLAGVAAATAALAGDAAAGTTAAEAIMTTDTVAKTVVVQGDGFTVGGMAKGAGMLAPGLATMLVVLTTDAVASPEQLSAALRAATRVTFDRIDSDGAMSTNDTVLLLASGAAGTKVADDALAAAVHRACAALAAALIADAEGATKEIAIEVVHAVDEDDAVQVGRSVARNNLVKTAFFGQDPNWGRILAAVGTTAAAFDPDAVDVAINGVWICRGGAAGEDRSTVDLTGRAVHVVIDLHAGTETATILTNDLSHAYVHENSAYST
ncbi:bifunctional glutamate N-acetyltransferase/amino-acid acetyltransferase ArgJ [Nakamurella lactea]|uniref:bifunctional glutamate N-acetyltransferase/amino-acid acetyltransferase ArgJ n=1 Tax=Nakamurella lactea TaxID=459515 RepID=UPI00040E247A|nr:bifunctional glutamate N-acetyltransferase/amino-acid acetyltransferase ArgJ [Nakamurella lactea]